MGETSIERPYARSRAWLGALVVAALTFVAFEPSLAGQWLHWDDDKHFVEHEAWRGLSASHLRWMFTTFHLGPYQPLSWVSLGFDHEMYGMEPRGYHATNIVLQAVVAAAFFGFARTLFQHIPSLSAARGWKIDGAAALAALFFAVHPLRVESVAWITERRDVLSGLFFALTCWTYVRFAASTGRARTTALLLALVCYTLSLAAKGLGMTLPLGLLVLDVFVLRRWNGTLRGSASDGRSSIVALVREKTGFFVLGFVAGLLAWKGQSEFAAMRDLATYGLGSRIAQSFFGLFFYVWKTLVPLDLIPLVPLPAVASPAEPRFAIAIVTVLVVAACAWLWRKRVPALVAGLLVYAIFVGPVLGLTQTGPQLVADRYSYLACMPFALLFGGGLLRAALAHPARASVFAAVGVAIVLALVPLTRAQSRIWHDDITLWTKTVAVRPDDAPAFRNLTLAHLRLGENETDPARAQTHFESALAECERGLRAGLDAGLLSNASSACRSLAVVDALNSQKHLEKGFDYARRAVERSNLEPTPTKVAFLNLGFAALDLGRPLEAVAPFAWYADHSPEDADAALRLAQVLNLAGRPQDALIAFEATLELAPGSPRVWIEKGGAHMKLGENAEAARCIENGLKLAASLPPESAEDPAEVAAWRGVLESLQKQ